MKLISFKNGFDRGLKSSVNITAKLYSKYI